MTSPYDPQTPSVSSRRRFLKGVGVALALPWLESLPLRAQETGKLTFAAAAPRPPVRFGCLFFSNGVEPEHWWAEQKDGVTQFGAALEPMLPYRSEINFLRGLFNENAATHRSPHLGKMANLLSGGWVSTDQSDIRVAKTMDQLLAQQIGRATPIPSLVVGIEPTEMRLEDNLSMIYGSCISWASDTKPATKEIYPSRVFDLLVGNSSQRRLNRSVLDEVLTDAQEVHAGLGKRDRQKLDEYMESIRDIERRIELAARDDRLEGWHPSLSAPNMDRPAEDLPQDVPEHMRLILDLIVLAFQMDKTRIFTCMLNNDLSQMNFGFLPGVQGSLHLDLTHNGRRPEAEAMYLKTNQFHLQQFAYLLDRFKSIDEGGSTMLDNSMLMCCSNLFDGDRHQATEMPILIAGQGGGSLKPGRILDYSERGDENRRACSLYLSLMDRMGVSLPNFGDSDRRLADL